MIKVSDFIADFISKITSTVFVGQGGSIIHILDSLKKKKLKIIPSQNEQCATIAADAYSRLSKKKIGVTAVTSGPGAINTLQGIACSYYDSIPTLTITGQVVTKQLSKHKKIRQTGFQEMKVSKIVSSFTKYAVILKNKNKIKYELEKLIYYAHEGRKGPVLIDIPDDIQRSYINPKKLVSFKIPKKKQSKLNKKKFIDLINNSKRPILILGNGINLSDTKDNIRRFVNKTKIPFLLTWATLDLFNYNHPQMLGTFGVAANRYGNFCIQNSDLIICLGTQLNNQLTGHDKNSFAKDAKKIVVDVDKFELIKKDYHKIDLKINLDLKYFFDHIPINKIKKNSFKNWTNKNKKIQKLYPIFDNNFKKKIDKVNPYYFMRVLSLESKSGDVLIPDASANLIWAYQSFKIDKKQKVFTALNHSPMGYSMPATIGAYMAKGKNSGNIICTIGDGSMAMNVQELATIKHFNLPIKIFVIDNGGYGLIKQTQDSWLKSRRVGVDPKSGLAIPNYLKIAKAYGLQTVKIKNDNEVKKNIKLVLNSKKPVLCNVLVSEKQIVSPKLLSGLSLENMSPILPKKEITNIKNYLRS